MKRGASQALCWKEETKEKHRKRMHTLQTRSRFRRKPRDKRWQDFSWQERDEGRTWSNLKPPEKVPDEKGMTTVTIL